jgi:segregation and condensation protein B
VTDADPPATAQQLGESFAALVGGREWQVDDIPEALPVAEPIEEPAPSKKAAAVPLAEAANDPAIPPTPIQIIEALLFVGGPPLKPAHAADAIRGLTAEQFRDCVDALNRLYRAQNRPYSVVHGPTGYVLRVSAKYAAVKEKLYGGPREARLNQPALDRQCPRGRLRGRAAATGPARADYRQQGRRGRGRLFDDGAVS